MCSSYSACCSVKQVKVKTWGRWGDLWGGVGRQPGRFVVSDQSGSSVSSHLWTSGHGRGQVNRQLFTIRPFGPDLSRIRLLPAPYDYKRQPSSQLQFNKRTYHVDTYFSQPDWGSVPLSTFCSVSFGWFPSFGQHADGHPFIVPAHCLLLLRQLQSIR